MLVELRSGFKDPMRNKRLKSRDVYDIERIINIHDALETGKKGSD